MSDFELFANTVHRLEEWFNKPLKGEQYDIFVKRLQYIPSKAMSDIVERYIDNNPPTPGKFPTVAKIREGWVLWKQENPQLVYLHQKTECPDCGGDGFLWFQTQDEESGTLYEHVARCGACENWRNDTGRQSAILVKSRTQLEAMGMKVFPYRNGGVGQWPPPQGGINSFVEKTFQPPPDGLAHYNKVQRQAKTLLGEGRT